MKGSDPAFPGVKPGLVDVPGSPDSVQPGLVPTPGMDIRTELAGRAMEGILSNGGLVDTLPSNGDVYRWIAYRAVSQADAVIAELQKGEPDAGTKG